MTACQDGIENAGMRPRYLLILPAAVLGFAVGLVLTGMLFDIMLPILLSGRPNIGAADPFLRPGGIIGAGALAAAAWAILKRV